MVIPILNQPLLLYTDDAESGFPTDRLRATGEARSRLFRGVDPGGEGLFRGVGPGCEGLPFPVTYESEAGSQNISSLSAVAIMLKRGLYCTRTGSFFPSCGRKFGSRILLLLGVCIVSQTNKSLAAPDTTYRPSGVKQQSPLLSGAALPPSASPGAALLVPPWGFRRYAFKFPSKASKRKCPFVRVPKRMCFPSLENSSFVQPRKQASASAGPLSFRMSIILNGFT